MGTANHGAGQKVHEVGLIAPTHAIVDPRTVVVHADHTPIALATVVGTGRLKAHAHFAVLQTLLLLGLLEGLTGEDYKYLANPLVCVISEHSPWDAT